MTILPLMILLSQRKSQSVDLDILWNTWLKLKKEKTLSKSDGKLLLQATSSYNYFSYLKLIKKIVLILVFSLKIISLI